MKNNSLKNQLFKNFRYSKNKLEHLKKQLIRMI